MNFEPQKLYIGLVEFFSVLLPGAVVVYLICAWKHGGGSCNLEGPEPWAVFLFLSYLLGHFLFLLASLLDDYVYDPIRKSTDEKQAERKSKGEKPYPDILNRLARLLLKDKADAAQAKVIAIKEEYLKQIDASETVNAFQWCKARLAIEHPEALAMVNGFEADSKFFRSFIPILAFLLGYVCYLSRPWLVVLFIILLGFAFWRYVERRFKSTQQAYWIILTLEASDRKLRGSGADHRDR